MLRRPSLAVVVLLLAATGACTDTGEPPAPAPIRAKWTAVDLPAPPGPAGRVAVRDAVRCAGSWYVVGGVFAGDESRPAGWSSTDGVSWTSLRLDPEGYWARRAVLSSVACRDGQVAMIGARSGGAHGNPRVSTWYQRAEGAYVDVIAGYTLFGGPQAVSVGKMAAGPAGWLIAGNRTSGAAVWTSTDATEFALNDTDPQLSKDEDFDTSAIHQVHDGTEWTVVGSATTPGRLPRVPMAWTSPDGRDWAREEVPASEEFNDLERVVALDDGLVAVGLRGERYGVWERRKGFWRAGESFGQIDDDGRAAPFVNALTTSGHALLAAVSDASRYGLWASDAGENWRAVRTPTRPTTAGEHVMSVVAEGDEVLLIADDGEAGRVWSTRWPG